MLTARIAQTFGLLSLTLSASSSLQLAGLVAGLLIVALAGIFTIRAKAAETWQQAYEAQKALADQKAIELIEVRRLLSEAHARIAVFEQAPKFDDLTRMMRAAADATTAEHHAILDGLGKVTQILSRMEKRLTP